MKKGQLCLLVLILLSLIPLPRSGYCYDSDYDKNKVFSTQLFYYKDYFDESHFEPNFYLKYRRDKIGDNEKIKLDFYGKVWADFTSGDEDAHALLYNFFLDFKKVAPNTNLRLGRSFVYTTAGAGVIDGVAINYAEAGSFGFTLAGGRDVRYSETGEFTKSGDYALFLRGYLVKFKGTNLDLSYYQKYDEDDLAREIVGINFRQSIADIASFYLESTFDIMAESFNLIQAGINVDPLENLYTTLEYYFTLPTFDSTSLYSVFAANRFQRIKASGRYIFSPKVYTDIIYSHQSFGDGDDANEVSGDVKYLFDEITTFFGQIIFRDGTGGDLLGFVLNGERMIRDNLKLAAGVQYNDFQRDLMLSSEDLWRFWAGAKYHVAENMRVSFRIEDNENEFLSDDIRARLEFNLIF